VNSSLASALFFMLTGMVPVTEAHDQRRRCHSSHHSQRKLNAIVGVELQLRKQIGASDAEEGTGEERQHAPEPYGLLDQVPDPYEEEQCP
jgi:hypothetical protein